MHLFSCLWSVFLFCALADLLHKSVFLHDVWFIILAKSYLVICAYNVCFAEVCSCISQQLPCIGFKGAVTQISVSVSSCSCVHFNKGCYSEFVDEQPAALFSLSLSVNIECIIYSVCVGAYARAWPSPMLPLKGLWLRFCWWTTSCAFFLSPLCQKTLSVSFTVCVRARTRARRSYCQVFN